MKNIIKPRIHKKLKKCRFNYDDLKLNRTKHYKDYYKELYYEEY